MEIYGGLYLENLVTQDKHFDLQMELASRGLIQGLQLQVAHPVYTPELEAESLRAVLGHFPTDLKLFIHCGAENTGADLGQKLDEVGVYSQRGAAKGITWEQWNQDTLVWAKDVAAAAGLSSPWGVEHPGYGDSSVDEAARIVAISALGVLAPAEVALENVPPVVDKALYQEIMSRKVDWPQKRYWGFGGTPEDMARLLSQLGVEWRCLIDFTHLMVAVNQARASLQPGLEHM